MSEHIPTPWIYQERSDAYTHIVRSSSSRFIFQLSQDTSGEAEATARLIVKAVNSHAAMAKALLQIEQISDNCVNAERYTAEDALNHLQGIRNIIKSLPFALETIKAPS